MPQIVFLKYKAGKFGVTKFDLSEQTLDRI